MEHYSNRDLGLSFTHFFPSFLYSSSLYPLLWAKWAYVGQTDNHTYKYTNYSFRDRKMLQSFGTLLSDTLILATKTGFGRWQSQYSRGLDGQPQTQATNHTLVFFNDLNYLSLAKWWYLWVQCQPFYLVNTSTTISLGQLHVRTFSPYIHTHKIKMSYGVIYLSIYLKWCAL